MSAFSISAVDKLVQHCKKPASMEEGKPLFSFYPPLYETPPIEPQSSLSPPSPSPYVVNFKWRRPVRRAHAQGDSERKYQDPSESNQSAVLESHEEAMNAHMPERNPSLEFGISGYCEDAEKAGNGFDAGIGARMRDHVQDGSEKQVSHSRSDISLEKLIVQSTNSGQELGLDNGTKSAAGLENSRFMSPRASITTEEFFDAPDAPLDDSSSEDESSSSRLIMRMLGRSAEKLTPRLQEEIARRIKAEEASALLQRRWNEMAKKCSLIGISLTSGQDKFEVGRPSVQDLYEQFSEKLVVARLVGGAIASAAVRAEKDEDLESMVARKNQEISRLGDKLQYLELVNREMSQRNQEAIEIAQRRKRRHMKRQKWAVVCFCSALCLGTAGLLCCKLLPWDRAEAWSRSLKSSPKIEPSSSDSCST